MEIKGFENGDWEEIIYIDEDEIKSIYHWSNGDSEERAYIAGILQRKAIYYYQN